MAVSTWTLSDANSRDTIDSRDIIARIEELEDTEDDLERDELAQLKRVAEECEGYGDWAYGEALIPEDEFEDYARELADDIGAIDRNAKWPLSHIDWTAAANELKQDYTEVEINGFTYLMRA